MTSLVPSSIDHDLALHLVATADLAEHERVVCTLIALAATVDEPVQRETLADFQVLLRRTAAS